MSFSWSETSQHQLSTDRKSLESGQDKQHVAFFFQKIKKRTTNHSFRKKNLKIKRLKHVAYSKPMCLVLFYFYFFLFISFFPIGSFTIRFLLIFLVYFLFQLHHSITLLIIDWVTQFVLIWYFYLFITISNKCFYIWLVSNFTNVYFRLKKII
jgi:hypothetical protein